MSVLISVKNISRQYNIFSNTRLNNYICKKNIALKNKIIIGLALMTATLISACSTEKNTAFTRFYHNLTTRYNIYFNGYMAFNSGLEKIEKADESYVQMLPVYKAELERMPNLVRSDMDRAVQKSVKAIKTHSITVKPDLKKTNGRLSPEQEAFMNKTEYNRWVDDAYLLIGKAHYYKGEYRVAMKSLQTILTKFRTEEIRFDAMYWIARCYSALGETREADNYITQIKESPEYESRLDSDLEKLKADIALKQKRYEDAVTLLKPVITRSKEKSEKARLTYLLAQLYEETDNKAKAREHYEKVIKINPSYDMVFSSKLKLAETYETEQGNSEALKNSLRKMLKDDKNKDYRDQIYYALAEIEMTENNISEAEKNYQLSVRRSTKNQNQKALSFLALANIYFERPEYLKASAYYDSTMSVLSKDYVEYDKISKTAENLSQLTDNLKIVAEEDSLQKVAKMSESERMNLINNLIAQVKADERAAQNTGMSTGYDPFRERNYEDKNTKGKWLFYNPQALSIGKNEFLKNWGNRKLEDHWRRSNKAALNQTDEEETESLGDRISDNKDPEYYLQDLPLTDSAMDVSNERMAQALFAAAYTYENQMNAYPEAIDTYQQFLNRFGKHPLVIEAYFNLYMIHYKELNNKGEAEKYRNKILNEYPDSKYANILSNPNYLEILKETKDRVNNLYEKAYASYKNGEYSEVLNAVEKAREISPQNDLIPGFMYFEALALGGMNQQAKMGKQLEALIQKYPRHQITPRAKETLRVYKSGKFDPQYYTVPEAKSEHYYILITDSENKELINTMKFMLVDLTVELFPAKDITVSEESFADNKVQIVVKSLASENEAQKLYAEILDNSTFQRAYETKFEHFYISKNNYNKLIKLPITEKYMAFFKANL
jgi:tetratricopeptide (TPR) repeat protein